MMRWYRTFLFSALLTLFAFPLHLLHADGKDKTLSQEQVSETLERYILERSPWQPDQVEVILRSFSSPALPEGEIDIAVLKPNRGVTPGLHRFLISVRVNGQEEARVWVDTDVRVFVDVVVTSQTLARYEPLTPEKVRLERRDLGGTPAQPLTSLEELKGMQASRPAEVNQVLTASMVEAPRVIRRGSLVTLVYESVGLRIETPGKAVEPGRVGDLVRVENPTSGKVLQGQVLDDRTVKVN